LSSFPVGIISTALLQFSILIKVVKNFAMGWPTGKVSIVKPP